MKNLVVEANAEAMIAVGYLSDKELQEEFAETVEALVEESEQLRDKVAYLLDETGNENLGL